MDEKRNTKCVYGTRALSYSIPFFIYLSLYTIYI